MLANTVLYYAPFLTYATYTLCVGIRGERGCECELIMYYIMYYTNLSCPMLHNTLCAGM